MMIDNNKPVIPGNNNPINLHQTEEKSDIAIQEKIRMFRESQSLLRQINRLEKEIARDTRKLQHKEEKLASLVDRFQLHQSEEKRDIDIQEKIRMIRESRSLLTQIDRLDKEIASDTRKLQQKKEKLALLVDRL